MENIIDYAQHLIKVEKLLRQVHDYAVNRGYSEAFELIAPIQAELRLLSATLAIMQNATIR